MWRAAGFDGLSRGILLAKRAKEQSLGEGTLPRHDPVDLGGVANLDHDAILERRCPSSMSHAVKLHRAGPVCGTEQFIADGLASKCAVEHRGDVDRPTLDAGRCLTDGDLACREELTKGGVRIAQRVRRTFGDGECDRSASELARHCGEPIACEHSVLPGPAS